MILAVAILVLLAVLGYCFVKRKKEPPRPPVAPEHLEDTEHLVYNSTTKPIWAIVPVPVLLPPPFGLSRIPSHPDPSRPGSKMCLEYSNLGNTEKSVNPTLAQFARQDQSSAENHFNPKFCPFPKPAMLPSYPHPDTHLIPSTPIRLVLTSLSPWVAVTLTFFCF